MVGQSGLIDRLDSVVGSTSIRYARILRRVGKPKKEKPDPKLLVDRLNWILMEKPGKAHYTESKAGHLVLTAFLKGSKKTLGN